MGTNETLNHHVAKPAIGEGNHRTAVEDHPEALLGDDEIGDVAFPHRLRRGYQPLKVTLQRGITSTVATVYSLALAVAILHLFLRAAVDVVQRHHLGPRRGQDRPGIT